MRGKLIAALVIAVVAAAPAAWAQAPCSLQTVTGTYAVQTTGWSASGSMADIPGYGPVYNLVGGSAVLVGQATIAANGTYTGSYWGVYVAAPIPTTPFTGRISINPDCTGESSDLGGIDELVVLDNGKEIRAITRTAFGTILSTWYRMTPANGQGPSCGRQTFSGTYVERCEGYSLVAGDPPGVATSNSLMVYSARDGVLTGTYKGKVFGYPTEKWTESGLSATYTVSPDCTIEKVYSFGFLPAGYTVKARGVLYDEGKQGVGLPMGIYAGNTFAMPVGPLTCQTVRLGK
jgi:hypothetical protein